MDASLGILTVTNHSKWSRAIYKVPNLKLNTNNYTCTETFSISFKKGSSAIVTNGALPLGIIAFSNINNYPEFVGACIRQIKKLTDLTSASLQKLNGKNENRFSHSFDGTRLGLSVDESGNWLDAESDQLMFDFSLRHTGGQWIQVCNTQKHH